MMDNGIIPVKSGIETEKMIDKRQSNQLRRVQQITASSQSFSAIPVGAIYQCDDHVCDVYSSLPMTDIAVRMNLIVWIDVRSRYIVGCHMSCDNNKMNMLSSLYSAISSHSHIPAHVYSETALSFTGRMISDADRFFHDFGIKRIPETPANSRGRGLLESWFYRLDQHLASQFSTSCRHLRTPDEHVALLKLIEEKKVKTPSFFDLSEAISAYIRQYNRSAQTYLGNKSPSDLWAELDRVPFEPRSQLEEAEQKRLADQQKRIDDKIADAEANAQCLGSCNAEGSK
jgi:putative transposase